MQLFPKPKSDNSREKSRYQVNDDGIYELFMKQIKSFQ